MKLVNTWERCLWPAEPKRLGFLEGEIEVPDDFDRMVEREIAALFGIGA